MFEFTRTEYEMICNECMLNEEYKKLLEMKIKGYTRPKMTMDLLVDSYKWLKLSEYADGETDKSKYKQVSDTLFDMFMVEHNHIGEIFKR